MPASNLAPTRVSPPKLLMPSTEVTSLRPLNSIAQPQESVRRKQKRSSKISSAERVFYKRVHRMIESADVKQQTKFDHEHLYGARLDAMASLTVSARGAPARAGRDEGTVPRHE